VNNVASATTQVVLTNREKEIGPQTTSKLSVQLRLAIVNADYPIV
jgi:hypothetical protein